MAFYTTNEKIYPFLGDHRRGFELFWQTAYVLHLEARKAHSSHRGAGFAEVAAAAVHPATVWLEIPERHTTTQLHYMGFFFFQGKLHQIICVFTTRPQRRCIIKTSHIADSFFIRRAQAANLL